MPKRGEDQSSSWKLRSCVICVGLGCFVAMQLPEFAKLESFAFFYDGIRAGCIKLNDDKQNQVAANATSSNQRKNSVLYTEYKPAPVEAYIMNHTKELNLELGSPHLTPTCHLWRDNQSTPFHSQLMHFVREIEEYHKKVSLFQLDGVKDLRRNITKTDNQVCELLKLHPEGLPGLFNKSQQLSFTRSGWVEPLYPSMRHPQFCLKGKRHLMNIQYILHDFYALCQNLQPTSRTIFVDMGASLSFHGKQQTPVFDILDLFRKFGFKFDHIYGYELAKQDPNQVWDRVPEYYEAAYHWINVGVASEPSHRRNPFRLILDNFNEDDLIIVKLDIDSPSLERKLADQLSKSPRLATLIDHFYFEHHVNQEELFRHWGRTKESVIDSMRLFQLMRQHGIAAHYWV